MTLPLIPVVDQAAQQNFERIALQFPVQARFLEPPVTSLPATPQDGQVITYTADATNGISWLLRYRAASASAYKWEFVGGPPLFAEVTADETTASTSYTNLATTGPTVTVPLAGDYDVQIAHACYFTAGSGQMLSSYAIGVTAAVDADSAITASGGTGFTDSASRKRRKTALAAATALQMKYRVTAGTGSFNRRWIEALPVRVG